MKSIRTRWTIFNIFLFTLGIGLGAGHYPTDFDGVRCPTYEGDTLIECFQFGALLGAVTGLTIGIGQGVFLGRNLSWHRNKFISWVAVTTFAFALGHAIGDSAPIPQLLPLSALGLGLLSGFMLGGLQWLILRSIMEDAIRWLWRSTFGFGIGLGLVGVATIFLLDSSRNSIFGWSGLVDLMIFAVLDGLLIGGIWAALTGWIVFENKL